MNSTLTPYPARRSPIRLADIRPTAVIDTREQAPLVFTRLSSQRATLLTGDYSFLGAEEQFAIERKSIADLVGCCVGTNRKRFLNELHRLRGFRFKRLLVVGDRSEIETGQYRSAIPPKSVLGTLAAIETDYLVPVVFIPTPAEAAFKVEEWIWYFARGIVLSANNLLPSRTNNNTHNERP